MLCRRLSFMKAGGSDTTSSWICWEGKRRGERLVEERISKIMQRTKQSVKTEIRGRK